MLYQLSYFRIWYKLKVVGVVGFEPTQPKHWIYSPAHLSNCGAPPNDDPRSRKKKPPGGRADGRTRTADQLITNQLLYQLSYTG